MIKQTKTLHRCPKCNGDKIFMDIDHKGVLWGCGIGCANIVCPEWGTLIIKYALSEEKAQQRAVKAWDKRCKRE